MTAAASVSTEPAWLSLFHRRDFHALNVERGDDVVALRSDDADGTPVAAASGVVRDGVLTVGFSAPFGGIDFARRRETPERICAAVDELLGAAAATGAGTIRIRGRSSSWSPNEQVVQFALLNRGFGVEEADLSYAIDLREWGDAEAYVAALKSPARRALRHAAREPFAFSAAADWEPGYAVLDANRRARGRRLALGLDYLERARAAFGDRIRMWELRHDGDLCAAALVFEVAPQRWYVQAWGDAGHRLRRSPMNELAHRVVAEALTQGVEVVDLGRTTEPAAPGQPLRVAGGLAQFKQSILARAELRPVLVR